MLLTLLFIILAYLGGFLCGEYDGYKVGFREGNDAAFENHKELKDYVD